MELICKREALDDNGKKILKFTKGLIYDFEELSERIEKGPNVVYFIEPDEIELNNYNLEDIKTINKII